MEIQTPLAADGYTLWSHSTQGSYGLFLNLAYEGILIRQEGWSKIYVCIGDGTVLQLNGGFPGKCIPFLFIFFKS